MSSSASEPVPPSRNDDTHWRPIIALLLLSPLLAELISESAPASIFFRPGTFIWFFIGYSLPVLLIREYSARRNLSVAGIYALGAGYGILNEGLFGKTLIRIVDVPNPAFNHYGIAYGIGFPWTFTICLWHGAASVLFPILFVDALYPATRGRPWINAKLAVASGIGLLGLSVLCFLGPANGAGTRFQLAIFLAFMLASALIAERIPKSRYLRESEAPADFWPFFLGFSILFFNVVLSWISGSHSPLPIFYAILAGGTWGYIALLRRRKWMDTPQFLLFGIGLYAQSAFLGTVFKLITHSVAFEALITGILAEAALIGFAIRLLSKKRRESA